MSLIVEDGTGLADAESYVAVADADTYFSNRSISTWTGTIAAKEAALRLATEYIESRYGARFKGYRKTRAQALKWPRSLVPIEGLVSDYEAYLSDSEIPLALKYATCEAALRASTGELTPDLERGGAVQSVSVAGAVSKTYFAAASSRTVFTAIDQHLRDLVEARTVTLERA